jgi:hypothetical protein
MKLWHGKQEYDLPPMGGPDPNTWPRLQPVGTVTIPTPGTQSGAQGVYLNGLAWWKGKLWATVRFFYAVDPAASLPLTLYAQDGEQITTNLSTQKFSGFVKRGPGLEPLLGCGGYESGQGSQSGPSLATISGQKLIEYQWPDLPGTGLQNWNLRAPRDTNYRPFDQGQTADTWVAWNPRDTNGDGVPEGRWASDRIWGGGLALPDGITYWPWMATGDIDYRTQTPTFAVNGRELTYQYRYDLNSYQFIDYRLTPEIGRFTVYGHELGPDGKVYLSIGYNWWDTGGNSTDTAIKVFG